MNGRYSLECSRKEWPGGALTPRAVVDLIEQVDMLDATCVVCGTPLSRKGRKYCSFACLGEDRRKTIKVTCPCGTVFEAGRTKVPEGKGKYCSKACFYAYRPSGPRGRYGIANPNATAFKPGNVPWNKGVKGRSAWRRPKGVHLSPATEFQPGQTAGNRNWRWNGGPGQRYIDRPGYRAIHLALVRRRGRAASYSCAFADATCKGRMEWACISQQYRDEDDFMPLCRSHHLRYDGGTL